MATNTLPPLVDLSPLVPIELTPRPVANVIAGEPEGFPSAQTQASVLNAITTNPVSVPAPISVEAAKIGIFSTPTFPEPPAVSVPNANTTTNPMRGVGNATNGGLNAPTPVNPGQEALAQTQASVLNAITTNGGLNAPTPTAPVILPSPKIDWRVKLTLSNNADWATKWFGNKNAPTILSPLATEKGVTFPYTPTIQMGYKASYDSPDIQHTNFRVNFYRNSYVDDITISAEFTAQDTLEANYLLATMHFFKTVTKMFYGRDKDPIAGTPPPLLFLSGYGKNQFDRKPLLLTSFSYTLPNDVDYIRTNTDETWSGISIENIQNPSSKQTSPPKSPIRDWLSKTLRLETNKLPDGAETPPPPNFLGRNLNNSESTYVPTKIQLSLTLKPVVNRFEMSNNYGTNDYAREGGFW